jgi:hypothetical protein
MVLNIEFVNCAHVIVPKLLHGMFRERYKATVGSFEVKLDKDASQDLHREVSM